MTRTHNFNHVDLGMIHNFYFTFDRQKKNDYLQKIDITILGIPTLIVQMMGDLL